MLFSGHWRAPSVLPRIHYAPSKIIWEAGVDPTASRGLKLGPPLISIPPDSRKSGKEGAGVTWLRLPLACCNRQAQRAPPLPHCLPAFSGWLFISLSDLRRWPPTLVIFLRRKEIRTWKWFLLALTPSEKREVSWGPTSFFGTGIFTSHSSGLLWICKDF